MEVNHLLRAICQVLCCCFTYNNSFSSYIKTLRMVTITLILQKSKLRVRGVKRCSQSHITNEMQRWGASFCLSHRHYIKSNDILILQKRIKLLKYVLPVLQGHSCSTPQKFLLFSYSEVRHDRKMRIEREIRNT